MPYGVTKICLSHRSSAAGKKWIMAKIENHQYAIQEAFWDRSFFGKDTNRFLIH
jgi:hypothetical protein